MHLLSLLCLLAFVHAPATPPSIRQVLDAQVAAWNRGDIPGYMAGYHEAADTEFVTARGIVRGWKTVLATYRKSYPTRAAMGTLSFSGVELNQLCPDAALVTLHFHLVRAEQPPLEGVSTLVVRRFGEGWRIISDHSTATPGA